MFIANQMFELPTQLSSRVLEITKVRGNIQMNKDDDNTDREISCGESEDAREATYPSKIEEDDLDIQQEVLHVDQARRDKTIWTTRVPLPKNRSRADTVIARTPLPTLQHPVVAIAPPLLKYQKSAINRSRLSDVLLALPLPKAGGDHNVPQPKAGGDHNVPQNQQATFEVVKRFMEAIVFTTTPWSMISDEE